MLGGNGFRDFNKFMDDLDLEKYPSDYFVGKTNEELINFIQQQQECMDQIRTVMEVLQNYSTTLGDVRQAKVVLEHWKRFNEFLDVNPDYKQEWDTLCMAMRLQES